MWNALPLSTRCAQRREWQISWLLDNLPNIKSNHWFIVPFAVGRLPDLRHTLVDIGTTLLCISGYNGLPCRTSPINFIHETAQRSERVDNAALSSAVSYEIPD